MFVHGSREPFMGVWNWHTNSGTVHYADYDALPAKKIWSWGVDADGLDWRKALSDNNSAYMEVQGGLFRNQETYAFLEPRRTIQFSEYWMPVREIGAITRANLTGVLALNRDGRDLVIGFNSNQAIPSATVSVLAGEKQVWSGRADLIPERTYSQRVPTPDTQQKYTVEVRDHSGSVLMRQTEDQYDWTPVSEIKVGPQTSYKIPAPENRSEDDWLQLGDSQELNGELLLAWQTYSGLLKKDHQSYAGLKAAGRLGVTLLHYEDAVKALEQAGARNTTDGEAAYYLGLAYEGSGLNDKARNALESAYRLPQWRTAAAVRLAELSARETKLAEAERYLKESVESNPNDARAAEELAAITDALQKNDGRVQANNFSEKFPLSYLLREETGNADLQQLANDSSRILNVAAEYMRLGLYQKALDVLSRSYPQPAADQSEPGTPAAVGNPMLAYYRAYCREGLGDSAATDYKAAASLPTDYIFPSSAQDLAVLRAAVKANPSDSHAHYLLGTLYFSKGFTDQALSEWNAAKQSNANIPVLDASMGIAFLHVKDDPEAALKAFADGIQTDPRNEVVYFGADQALSILKKPSTERVNALEKYPDQANMPAGMVFELALNRAESGDYDRAAALFHDRFFPREEGGTNVRQVWVEVRLLRALDRNSIAHELGSPVAGVSFTSDGMQPFINSGRTNYLLGEMDMQCKMAEQAKPHFTAAAGKQGSGEIVWAWRAAKQLSGFDASQWTGRLESALQQAGGMTESSSFAGWWVYNHGMLNRVLGHELEAQQDFRKVFLLPDRMLSYHLAREAMAAQ